MNTFLYNTYLNTQLNTCSIHYVQHMGSDVLAQVMACCLTAPSHYLNQGWFKKYGTRCVNLTYAHVLFLWFSRLAEITGAELKFSLHHGAMYAISMNIAAT